MKDLDLSFILGSQEPESAAQPKKQQAPGLAREKQRDSSDKEEALRICRENQERTARTGQLQAEILKGLKSGEDIYSLFLKAVEALSLAVSNTQLFTQASQDITTIYGEGLKKPKPLEMELRQVEGRLQALLQAEEQAESAEDRERIHGAISAHVQHRERLQAQLRQAEAAV